MCSLPLARHWFYIETVNVMPKSDHTKTSPQVLLGERPSGASSQCDLGQVSLFLRLSFPSHVMGMLGTISWVTPNLKSL